MQTLYLFSSIRAAKHFVETNFQEGFLPDIKSLGEFMDFILCIENKVKIPSFLRTFYLYEALSEVKLDALGEFAKNFTSFLENSDFFLKFYDELCAECIKIEQLEELDIYAFYDDHLKVLKQVFTLYRNKLSLDSFYDQYFLQDYKITYELLAPYEKICIFVEGFLSAFEFSVFRQISYYKKIEFVLNIEEFNKEYYCRLFKNDSLLQGSYKVILKEGEVSFEKESNTHQDISATLEIFSTKDRIAQVGGIFKALDEWIAKGVPLEEICIVLPNEDFIKYLKLFDEGRNFNYAMGVKLKNTSLFLRLQKQEWNSFGEFEECIEEIQEACKEDKEVKERLIQLLEYYKLGFKFITLGEKEKVASFLKMAEKEQIDDVGGGKISVIGILETRGVKFDYVIIPEFIEENIPKTSNKDLFLNSVIRQKVGLPTRKDRENLQKYYYLRLFKNSKSIKIFTLDNEEQKPSRFLLEDKIFQNNKIQKIDESCGEYFLKGNALVYQEREIIESLTQKKFSSSSLECLLECRRKYYYSYILKYKPLQTSLKADVGLKIHQVLYRAYEKFKEKFDGNFSKDFKSLQKEILEALGKAENARERFELELSKKYLIRFLSNEEKRLKEGWIPLWFEKEFKVSLLDFEFEGRIDRIDYHKKNNEYLVLDYKYKKNPDIKKVDSKNLSNFQLPIYALSLGKDNVKAGIYDLYNGKILEDFEIKAKQERLKEILKDLQKEKSNFSFYKREKHDLCQFCGFKYLCNR
ncbi:PD-(D/E)XK nuclease family protein [Helicobacter burdigaliensis]